MKTKKYFSAISSVSALLLIFAIFSCKTMENGKDYSMVHYVYSHAMEENEHDIMAYVQWRGDLTFADSAFNEIDAAILTNLTYLNFTGLISPDFENPVELQELYQRFVNSPDYSTRKDIGLLNPKLLEIFKLACNSKRYQNILACNFEESISNDPELEFEFAAYTLLLPDGTALVSYRGTHDEFVGWKEDFNMAFKYPVPAQVLAAKYLDKTSELFEGKIRVVGHSKGGNLAVYAAAFTEEKNKDNIIEVYNFDGPGFIDEFLDDYKYISIITKVKTYVPENSIIGMLFETKGAITIVSCLGEPVFHHDLFTWEILANRFYRMEKRSKTSEYMKNTLNDWLYSMTIEERKDMINSVFAAIKYSGAKSLSDFTVNISKYYPKVTEYMNKLDKETKDNVQQAFSLLGKAIAENNKKEKAKK